MKNKTLILSTIAVAAVFSHHNATAGMVDLGSAKDFAVLAGSGITVAGAVNSSKITGDIGTYPTPSVTGLGNLVLNGVNQTGDAGLMLNAKNALSAAYTDAATRPYTVLYPAIYDLGNQTLGPGIYQDPSQFLITGTLTLDAGGDPNALWIFQAGSSLITAAGGSVSSPASSVDLINGAQACHVFWQVGSSATIGDYSDFVGNILAYTSISLDPYATIDGRALAENGAVTFAGYNTITESVCDNVAVPEPVYFWPLAFCASAFGAWQWLAVRRKAGRSPQMPAGRLAG